MPTLNYNEIIDIRGNLGAIFARTPGAIRITLEGMTAEEQQAWNSSPQFNFFVEDGKPYAQIFRTGKERNMGRPFTTVRLDKPITEITADDRKRLLNLLQDPK